MTASSRTLKEILYNHFEFSAIPNTSYNLIPIREHLGHAAKFAAFGRLLHDPTSKQFGKLFT